LGARLHAAGVHVTLLGRPALADAVARDGLIVTGHTTFTAPIPVITRPEGSYDVVFLTCKAHQTHALAAAVAPCVADTIVSLQNGLGNIERLTEHFGPERVVAALTSHGVMVEAPGRLRHAGLGTVKVGAPAPAATGRARVVEALLGQAGLAPQWMDDVRSHIWQKAIVNAGINPVAALLDGPNGAILEQPQALQQAEALVHEAVAVARAAGIHVPDMWPVTRQVLAATADNKCSMVQDVQAHRLTEIEQITGRIVRVARAHGIAVPHGQRAYQQVKDLEAGYLAAASAQAAQDEDALQAVV